MCRMVAAFVVNRLFAVAATVLVGPRAGPVTLVAVSWRTTSGSWTAGASHWEVPIRHPSRPRYRRMAIDSAGTARSLTDASIAMEALDKTALRLGLIAANRPGSRRADGP